MSQPVDRDNRSRPRVVLLATDRSQSIIGEIVDGLTKTIGYSAYGEQSAQQRVETLLGFNGQLREANIGWYLLGNGYRAYNPRLMRFHSPDSWSGLNAYMYCVGDPINRSDPTGHFGLWAFVRKVAGAFQLPNHRGGPLPKIDIYSAADAMRTMERGRKYGSTHDLTALANAADYITNNKPNINWGNDGGELHGSGFSSHSTARNNPAVPWLVSDTSQGSHPTPVNYQASSLTGSATKPGSPPNVHTTTMQLWNSDTKAAALNPQSSTTAYPIGVGSPSPSGAVQHGSTASSSVRPPTSAAVGSSTHSSINRPTAVVAAIRRDPPATQRSPSPSPPTSRDSTPPRSPNRNRRYGPNGDRYD